MNFITNIKKECREYNVPCWKLPDFILLVMAVINIAIMIFSYWWLSNKAQDPREAVPLVALEAALIMIVGNILVESSKRIISINRLKKEFVDIVSHQIRSPLSTIKWYMETLYKDGKNDFNKKQKIYLETVIDANEKILGLTNDLLNMINIERGRSHFYLEQVNLVEVIEESIRDYSIFAKSKRIKIDFRRGRLRKLLVVADRMKLKVAIENLLNNAIKYTYKGGLVEIKLAKDKDKIVVQSKDNGMGIKEFDKPYIFEKFYRAGEIRKMETSGTGLGLYICQVIAKGMGGNIWFNSNEGKGSIFYLSLEKAPK